MKVLAMFTVCSLVLGAIIIGDEALAKCEAAFARLKEAEAELNAAKQRAQQAQANLAQAVANLNAVAANLGAQGRATGESATFGRSPTDPTFFDNPQYKAAKQAWQDAKDANAKAQGDVEAAEAKRKKAQDEYNKLRAQHIGDEGYLKAPEPLKIDKDLSEKVEKIIQVQHLEKFINEDGASFDVEFILKRIGDKTVLETSILSADKGTRSRKWSPEIVGLAVDSAIVKPSETFDYYAKKEVSSRRASHGAGGAPYLLSAMTGQRTKGLSKASHSTGASCEVGATQEGAGSRSTGSIIGQAGMAAGVGLLTSQAKTKREVLEIKEGVGASFDVTKYEGKLKGARLKSAIVNEAAGKEIECDIPINFN